MMRLLNVFIDRILGRTSVMMFMIQTLMRLIIHAGEELTEDLAKAS